jgi:acyl dehydratase
VIAYRSEVTDKRALESRPGWGLLASLNEGVNGKGEKVLSFEGRVLVQMRA